jgi:hypothetical protein
LSCSGTLNFRTGVNKTDEPVERAGYDSHVCPC